MDYIGYTMNICLILFMISVTGSHCQYYSNRDIILTPHQLKTYPGKILYYRPHPHHQYPHQQQQQQVQHQYQQNELTTGPGGLDNVVPAQQQEAGAATAPGTSTAVPWEEVLKETVFLALNDNKTSAKSTDGSSTTTKQPAYIMRQQKAIYGAPYIGSVDLSVPRFGDIVELAHGRLESENDDAYFFVQEDIDGEHTSGRNVSAYWKVERIRHRDDARGHRYELKFTVAPVKDLQYDENAIVNRSFIIRDEDYPRYFGLAVQNATPMMKKNDQFVDRAVFDPLFPFHPSYPGSRLYRPTQPTMTLGEYLIQSLFSGGESTPKIQNHHHYAPLRLGSTFNRIKFPDSFTTSSMSMPKFYHHIHFQRPSIAPLAPTAPPMPPLIKEIHAPASSNIQQDYTKLVDLRGNNDHGDVKPITENRPLYPQSQRYPPPILPIQPTHIHHHHHQQPQQQQQQQQQPLPQQQQTPVINQSNNPQPHNPPPLQPLPQNLVQSIPVFNSQNQLMVNHIPIAPHNMIQVAQAPIAIPVHLQLVPSQGQVYAQQDGLHAVPIRIMQSSPVHLYSPVNPFLAPQHHPAYITPKHPNQTQHPFPHYSPNSIPTTQRYAPTHIVKYTPQPLTSPVASPTPPSHRYSPLPTVQASPAGLREKFTAPAFQPTASSNGIPPNHKLDADTAGSSPVDSAATPKFQSFGIENAVTPKTTTVVPVATAADTAFTPSLGHHTSSVHSAFFTNFIDEKGSVSESNRLYSEPDPLYHNKAIGTTPFSFTTPSSPVASYSYTLGPNFTPKFTSHPSSYKGLLSPTIVPPQIETPISSTLKSYHYLPHHDNFDFVPSRVVELAHVKKMPKKQGKRKNYGNHHHVTVTSHKPLKFSEAPDFATRRPDSQLSVQLPPPEKDFNTYYGSAKQNHKVQRPKSYSTQPYSSSTTPFSTSLTTPASSTVTSTTPTPSTTAATGSSTATTEKLFTQHVQSFYKNKNEKSDDIVTTMRPRLVIKTVYKQHPSSTASANAATLPSTEKPVLKWIPKRPRNKTTTSAEPTSSTSSSASVEQISSASSEHATIEVPTNKSVTAQGPPRASLENQMNRLRASRGRSRYTHRRATTPLTPPASQHPAKVQRMRSSSSTTATTSTTTATTKPISGFTSSTFDSNRIDNPVNTEQSAVAPISLKNTSNEKSKRDTATEENEVLVAEPLTSKLTNANDPTNKDYVMVQANVKPIETNNTNILLFEASDASVGPTGSSSPTFDDLTMSIINHARAIVNHTTQPDDLHDHTLQVQSNEISHRDDGDDQQTTTIAMSASITVSSTTDDPSSSGESTIQQSATTYDGSTDGTDGTDSTSSSRSETTVSVDNN